MQHEHGPRATGGRRRAAFQAKHPHCLSPQRRCASLNIPGWVRTPAPAGSGEAPPCGVAANRFSLWARHCLGRARAAERFDLVHTEAARHTAVPIRNRGYANGEPQGQTTERVLRKGTPRADCHQSATWPPPLRPIADVPLRHMRGIQSPLMRRRLHAWRATSNARMPDADPTSRCPARKAASAQARTPRHGGHRACTCLPRDAKRPIVFGYPCNLFATPNFFVRT